ncbi:MAG: hypothetical protein KDA87_25650 [Planctomycetales bacterium]|nr:hypothetical protein [Planctomycetales bacterium]
MNRFTFPTLALLAACVLLSGCGGQSNQQSETSSTAASAGNDGEVSIDEIFENHSVEADQLSLTTEDVIKRFGDAQKWTDFSLTETAPGQYEGQAKSPSGELLNVEVRQTTNGIFSKWTNADDSASGGNARMTW